MSVTTKNLDDRPNFWSRQFISYSWKKKCRISEKSTFFEGVSFLQKQEVEFGIQAKNAGGERLTKFLDDRPKIWSLREKSCAACIVF